MSPSPSYETTGQYVGDRQNKSVSLKAARYLAALVVAPGEGATICSRRPASVDDIEVDTSGTGAQQSTSPGDRTKISAPAVAARACATDRFTAATGAAKAKIRAILTSPSQCLHRHFFPKSVTDAKSRYTATKAHLAAKSVWASQRTHRSLCQSCQHLADQVITGDRAHNLELTGRHVTTAKDKAETTVSMEVALQF